MSIELPCLRLKSSHCGLEFYLGNLRFIKKQEGMIEAVNGEAKIRS
jgi:hypothetical protein